MNYETSFPRDGVALDEAAGGDRRRVRRNVIIGIVVAVLALAGAYLLFGQGGGEKPADAAAKGVAQRPTVSVIVPGRQPIARMIAATGTMAARVEMPVGIAGEGGMVSRVLVQPGQWVGAGQVLASIERSVQTQQVASMAASLNVARADARIAQAELDRSQTLVSRGFISKADVDRRSATRDAANARVGVAQAQLGEMRARNNRLDIRAPAAGLILTRAVEPGQVVGAGSATLFRMAQGGQMEVRAQLSEADLAGLTVGVPARVTPVGSTRSFDGQIWQISPIIDPQTRQGVARIAVAYDPALRPGGFAQATITGGSTTAPLLPESAVQSDAKGNFVYVVDAEGKVARRDVTVGEVSDVGVAVVRGLVGNERVVESAGAFLNPGQLVKPQLKKAR